MDTTPAARAHGISKRFGEVVALDDVGLEIAAGAIHGLAGPNGAGKTTLLGLLLGLASPDRGTVEVGGRPLAGRATDAVAGFLDGPALYPTLTARQNLAAVCSLRGLGTDRVERTLGDVGLADVADDRVRGFSLGMRQRLGLAAALLCRPRLLVLDEPTNGLDPAATRHIHGVLSSLVGDGTAVVLSSHRMDHLAALCSEVTILATGRVAYSGTLSDLADRQGRTDVRLHTTQDGLARQLATALELTVLEDSPSGLTLRASQHELDGLVSRLVSTGVGVRELTPLLTPVEAAYVDLIDAPCDEPEQVA